MLIGGQTGGDEAAEKKKTKQGRFHEWGIPKTTHLSNQ
jgi:hypothetical protein